MHKKFKAYHKQTKKIYPVVNLSVYGTIREHELLDVYNNGEDDGIIPTMKVPESLLILMEYIHLNDKNGDEIYTKNIVRDDVGRLYEIGYCFDLKEKRDRYHFARYEMKCIKNRGEDDHIKVDDICRIGDWVYYDNLLEIAGNSISFEHTINDGDIL